jgi:hypothetical protein
MWISRDSPGFWPRGSASALESAVSVLCQRRLNSRSGSAVKSLRVTAWPVRIFAADAFRPFSASFAARPLPSRQRSRAIDHVESACKSVDLPLLFGPASTIVSSRSNSWQPKLLKFSTTTLVIMIRASHARWVHHKEKTGEWNTGRSPATFIAAQPVTGWRESRRLTRCEMGDPASGIERG